MTEKLQVLMKKVYTEPSYTVRRFYVDTFYFRNVRSFDKNTKVLDMGGLKNIKRGKFNINVYGFDVKYANLNPESDPDYLCDIVSIPVENNSFDVVILSEVLEHIYDPKLVLKEAYRVLKSGGKALICTPFVYNLHADPYDFARYTDQWFNRTLSGIGFKDICLEKQGLFFSVLASMFKQWAGEIVNGNRVFLFCKRAFLYYIFRIFLTIAFKVENNQFFQNNPVFSGYTTGYGIIYEK